MKGNTVKKWGSLLPLMSFPSKALRIPSFFYMLTAISVHRENRLTPFTAGQFSTVRYPMIHSPVPKVLLLTHFKSAKSRRRLPSRPLPTPVCGACCVLTQGWVLRSGERQSPFPGEPRAQWRRWALGKDLRAPTGLCVAGVGEGSPGTSASPGFNFSAKMEGKHSCLPDRGSGESVYNQGRGSRRKEVKPETLTEKYHGTYGSHDPCQIWGNRVLSSRDSRLITNGRPRARKK